MAKLKELFFNEIKSIRKLLVLNLGFIGDSIHLLPALECIKKALPEAQLHVMVSEHIQSILEICPFVDKILGYPRFPKGPPWYKDIGRLRQLRKEQYDAIINLNGSDRSSFLTRGIGAKFRLGRTNEKAPYQKKLFWNFCFTHTVSYPRQTCLIYQQNLGCLKKAGFPAEELKFSIQFPPKSCVRVNKILEGNPEFIHISPFTTEDCRELPAGILAKAIDLIMEAFPYLKIVFTCAPNQRELDKLENLLSLIKKPPWKVFPGKALSLLEGCFLISKSRMHLGGNSGGIHMAMMANTPTLSWFHDYLGKLDWMPQGRIHKTLLGKGTPECILNITPQAILEAFKEHYQATPKSTINEPTNTFRNK